MAANGKVSLVPVAILINGKFWDASAYKADPIPMALEPGTVYEAERTGNSLGLFTVGSALHSNAANAPVPWLGTGAWHPTGTEPATKEQKAEGAPVGIEDTDAPPRLTRDPNRLKAAPPASSTSPSTGSAPPATPPASDKPKSSNSDEPPRLTKGTSPPASEAPSGSSTSGQGTAAPASPSGTSDSKPSESRPEAAKPSDAKADSGAKIPTSDSGASEANRPRLRRGKPAELFADEDVPGYSKPGVKPAAAAGTTVAPAAAPGDVQLIPAVSDATTQQMRPFTFDWIQGEEGDRHKQMLELAKQELRSYVEARAKSTTSAKAGHAQPAKHGAPPEPIFGTERMVAYDLWRSNQPVLILSAEAHMPAPPAGAAHSEYDSELTYSILLVAYPDIYNNMHKLYAGVTDKFHLDIRPRFELIDAVDADGDGVGELLFRETSDQGTGWAIYRVTADRLWKMYDSLKPE